MTSSDHENQTSVECQLVKFAVDFVNQKSTGSTIKRHYPITLNFHPDVILREQSLIANLVRDGAYYSQFETGTSNGGLSSHVGGRRWKWEHRIFGGVYDNAPTSLRPRYGALNFKKISVGGAPRFGSAHLRLKPAVIDKCTFAYPDSQLDPVTFGTQSRMNLIPIAERNAIGLDVLDDYIEAHVHGRVTMSQHVEAIVLDPCYQNTSIELEANQLPFDLEWHDGFILTADKHGECAEFRGQTIAEFIQRASAHEPLTPAVLGRFRNGTVDADVLKKAWHCLVRYGSPSH